MKLAHCIGNENHPNYSTREQIINCQEPIGFDGVYKNVYDNQDVLKGKTGIFFVMGDYVGGNNSFDLANVPRLEHYCTWDEIVELLCANPGFELGWHTWSHYDLTKEHGQDLLRQTKPPFYMKHFAYPYGLYNDLVVEAVAAQGFVEAWAVNTVNNEDRRYRRPRTYIR